ncbi:MAG: hypothetical protein R2757_13555 [Draconibacterium sp.]
MDDASFSSAYAATPIVPAFVPNSGELNFCIITNILITKRMNSLIGAEINWGLFSAISNYYHPGLKIQIGDLFPANILLR